jgi:hypothetical protein
MPSVRWAVPWSPAPAGRCPAGGNRHRGNIPKKRMNSPPRSPSARLLQQHPAEGVGKGAGVVVAMARVHRFELPDEIEDITPCAGTARRRAEVRATAKGTLGINQAPGGHGMQQGAGAIRAHGQVFPACCTERTGGKERLAPCEQWNKPRAFEMAAFGAQAAVPLHGPRIEFRVNSAHGVKRPVELSGFHRGFEYEDQ